MAPGLGDPYYPQAGNSGYDVAKYQIVLNWDPGTATLRGTTTITATATQRLDSFYLDLAVPTEAIKVNGKPATFAKEGFADVRVQPADPVTIGSDFQVVVDYAGQPGEIRQGEVRAWSTTNAEWTVANEPESSAWWFPANDHPSDPALMDISVRVPAGMEAISVGRLESADTATEPDFDTWHWIARQPMATYLNFLTIGQFEIQQGTEDGLPFVYAVTEQLPVKQRQEAFKVLVTSGDRIATLATMFGPYPFTEIGGVVPAFKFAFGGLETQTRPVYQSSAILNENYAPELINHELAHMWFGDNVTLREWNDIFNNEAYASWAQWGYNERVGGKKPTTSSTRPTRRRRRCRFLADHDDRSGPAAPVRHGVRAGTDGDSGVAERDRRRRLLPVDPGVGTGPGQPQPRGLDGRGAVADHRRPAAVLPGLDLCPHRALRGRRRTASANPE